MLGPNRVIAKVVKNCNFCCYVRYATLIVWVEEISWPKTGTTQYHAQLGLSDKGCVINWLVDCNNWDLESLDLPKGLALGCYQPFPEVLIVYYNLSNVDILSVKKVTYECKCHWPQKVYKNWNTFCICFLEKKFRLVVRMIQFRMEQEWKHSLKRILRIMMAKRTLKKLRELLILNLVRFWFLLY